MNGPRDQLFAGARFAGHKQVGMRRGHALDKGEDLLHRSRAADDVVHAIAAADLLAQSDDFAAQRTFGKGLIDAEQELVDLEGLGDVIVGAELHRPNGRVDGAEARHDDDERRGDDLANLAQEIETVEIRHFHVRNHKVDATLLHPFDPGATACGGFHEEPFVFEILFHPLAHSRVVVDHQDRGWWPLGS